jgi:acyl-CoA synthetase (AMP-forming)/AMP-acid ligase II
MIIPEITRKALSLYGKKEALVCGGRRFSYRDFDTRVTALCHLLHAHGIKKGGKVALLLPNCHRFMECYFAAAHLGAASVPINYRLSPRDIAYILNDSESTVLIADRGFAHLVAPALEAGGRRIETVVWTGVGDDRPLKIIEGVDYEEGLGGSPPAIRAEDDVQEDSIAQLYYTSGTTGRPKGVILTHKNICTHALGAIAELHLTDRDRWIHVAPMFHLADAWATWAITWVGGTHIFVNSFEPSAVLETMEHEQVTITNMIPTMLNLLVNHPDAKRQAYSSLRVLLSGGAPIAPEVVKKLVTTFRCDYIQTYGMTESSPYLTMSILKDHLAGLPDEEQLKIKAKTGREFIAVQLKVVREDGMEVARDEQEVGEIIVKGDIVTPAYWKLPEETEKTIKDGWLYTGDLAIMDAEGYVTIVDRKKDMILTGGENVYSTEVENVLYMHPAILEAAVIGVPDENWGEMVKAIVVLKQGMDATEDEIIDFCKERLARYKAPKSVEFLEALPKTGPGKIAKRELREKYWRAMQKRVH